MPDELVARIDGEARARQGTHDAPPASTARHAPPSLDPAVIGEAVRRSRDRFADTGEFDSAAAIREQRDGPGAR